MVPDSDWSSACEVDCCWVRFSYCRWFTLFLLISALLRPDDLFSKVACWLKVAVLVTLFPFERTYWFISVWRRWELCW